MKEIVMRLLVLFFIGFLVYGMVYAGAYTDQHGLLWKTALLIFGIQVVVFLPSYLAKTEHFFDLTGGLTYLSVMLFLGYHQVTTFQRWDLRSILLIVFISLWAIRLSVFLFTRVHRVGKDGRFDEIKLSFTRYLLTWVIQGLWVFMCTYPALIVLVSPEEKEVIFLGLGAFLWVLGWGYEVVADYQKTKHNKNPKQKGRFIASGLWKQSRHPNYFGEWLLWTGITLMAIPVVQSTQWVAVVTPFFVYLLLNKVSGVNLLETRADEKWGSDAAYQTYKKNTPVFFPNLFN